MLYILLCSAGSILLWGVGILAQALWVYKGALKC